MNDQTLETNVLSSIFEDMNASNSPTDWLHGEYPAIDDIKSWVHLTKIMEQSSNGEPSPEIPYFVSFFKIENISDLVWARQYHDARGFFQIYGTFDLWIAMQEEWLEHLSRIANNLGINTLLEVFPPNTKPLLTKSHVNSHIQKLIAALQQPDAAPHVFVVPEQQNAPIPDIQKTLVESQEQIDAAVTRIKPFDDSAPPITHVTRFAEDSMAVYRNSRLPGASDEVLGSGRTRGLIGQGGTAWVYLIELAMLEVFRAVKVIKIHELCQNIEQINSMKGRVEIEAKVTAQLQHSNIVQLFQYGEYSGLPYLEMEYVKGFDLNGLITKAGALPVELVVSIALFAAKALAHAHRQSYTIYGKSYQGIMHRDFKPQNLLLSISGQVKVSDFGLARPVDVSMNTMGNNIIGTLPYMSPEQLETNNVDTRTDIYALGATIYEMLTGIPMFPQKTIMDLMKVRQTNFYQPITEFRKDVPKSLLNLVDNCVLVDLNKRIRSVQVVVDNLEEIRRKLTKESAEGIVQDYIVDRKIYENAIASAESRGFHGFLHRIIGR